MPQNHRLVYHEIADATVLPIMHIGAANADSADANLHLPRRGRAGRRDLFDAQIVNAVQHGGGHGLSHNENGDAFSMNHRAPKIWSSRDFCRLTYVR